MSRIVNFKLHWLPNQVRYWAEKLQRDTKLDLLVPDENKKIRASWVLDFGIA